MTALVDDARQFPSRWLVGGAIASVLVAVLGLVLLVLLDASTWRNREDHARAIAWQCIHSGQLTRHQCFRHGTDTVWGAPLAGIFRYGFSPVPEVEPPPQLDDVVEPGA
jgi:hypothetical protein